MLPISISLHTNHTCCKHHPFYYKTVVWLSTQWNHMPSYFECMLCYVIFKKTCYKLYNCKSDQHWFHMVRWRRRWCWDLVGFATNHKIQQAWSTLQTDVILEPQVVWHIILSYFRNCYWLFNNTSNCSNSNFHANVLIYITMYTQPNQINFSCCRYCAQWGDKLKRWGCGVWDHGFFSIEHKQNGWSCATQQYICVKNINQFDNEQHVLTFGVNIQLYNGNISWFVNRFNKFASQFNELFDCWSYRAPTSFRITRECFANANILRGTNANSPNGKYCRAVPHTHDDVHIMYILLIVEHGAKNMPYTNQNDSCMRYDAVCQQDLWICSIHKNATQLHAFLQPETSRNGFCVCENNVHGRMVILNDHVRERCFFRASIISFARRIFFPESQNTKTKQCVLFVLFVFVPCFHGMQHIFSLVRIIGYDDV